MSEASWSRGPVTVYFGEKTGKYPDGNQVVVRGKDTFAIFDTPLVSRRLGAELAAAELVILGHAHEDHMAGLGMLPKAAVFAPEADAQAVRSWDGLARHYGYSTGVLAEMQVKVTKEFHYTPRPDAQAYGDGRVWDLGGVRVRAIHMPGHTGGHSVLLVEPDGIAFVGDIDLSSFGPYYGDACSSLADFRRSIARVADVPASAWITSHHKGVMTERAQFLELLKAFGGRIEAREQAILAALRDGPRTLESLVAERFLYPKTHRELWVEDVERITIGQHLASLEQSGRATREGGAYRATGR